MQEVDKDKAETFWKETLGKLGLEMVFTTAQGKMHGNIIAFNAKLFSVTDSTVIDYDKIEPEGLPKQIASRNTGVVVALKKNSSPDSGLVVATTHMFWHPRGSYERTRQLGILMDETGKFASSYKGWPIVLAGDFNSECFDSPYLCATNKPVALDDNARDILRESLRHKFKNAESEGDLAMGADDEPANAAIDDETTNDSRIDKQIDQLLAYFDSIPFQAKSLYAHGNRALHPTNVHPKGPGEPNFSNWAAKWRGLLDYIFILDRIDTPVPAGQVAHGVKLVELLRMPEPKEMGPEPSGQPRENQYPSDHLCLMAAVEFV